MWISIQLSASHLIDVKSRPPVFAADVKKKNPDRFDRVAGRTWVSASRRTSKQPNLFSGSGTAFFLDTFLITKKHVNNQLLPLDVELSSFSCYRAIYYISIQSLLYALKHRTTTTATATATAICLHSQPLKTAVPCLLLYTYIRH